MRQVRHAIIGGSGLYTFSTDTQPIKVPTPYGDHSSGMTIGWVGTRPVVFLPRHGEEHELPPHRINYRANLWALRSLGIEQVIAPCAVGSLQPQLGPGSLVVPNQVVDRTSGRIHTFVERGAAHISFADPYCPVGRDSLMVAAQTHTGGPVEEGTMVVINGPRFSTRAESQWYSREGWTVVNMTGQPEATLARELAICYSAIALVTDFDAGVNAESAVTQAQALDNFAANLRTLGAVLVDAIRRLPDVADCSCRKALDDLQVDYLPE